MTFYGFRQPAFSGISSSTSVRNTYSTAAMQTAVGALKLFCCCGEVPVKSISALRRLGSHFPLLLLSNVDRAPLVALVERLGIPFAEMVTAEDVRSYKPAPAHFQEAKRRLGSRAAGWLHIAVSSFHDLEPAQTLNIACCHLARGSSKLKEGVAPKMVVKDLLELCKKLGV